MTRLIRIILSIAIVVWIATGSLIAVALFAALQLICNEILAIWMNKVNTLLKRHEEDLSISSSRF